MKFVFLLIWLDVFSFQPEKTILIERDTLIFKLSGNASFNVRSVNLCKGKDNIYFSFLSRNRIQKIYIYNYPDRQMIDSVPVYKTGLKFQGHSMINRDSILVYDYNKRILLLINGKGEIIKKYNLKNEYVDPKVWTPMPIIYNNEIVYLGGYLYDPHNKYNPSPIVIKLNLRTGKIEYLYHYPETYLNNNWGGQGVGYWFYYDYIKDRKEFVFSFPFDEHVYITDLEKKNKSVLFKSKYLQQAKPCFYFKFIDPNLEKSCKCFVENPTYKSILYDPYRKVYYRIGEFPEKFTGLKWRKKITIIVYDKDFHYLTEKIIKDYYGNACYTMFVGPGGLYFQEKTDESVMAFKRFVLIKK